MLIHAVTNKAVISVYILEHRPLFQYKYGLSRYGHFHYKDKTTVRPSYLDTCNGNWNSCTGKTATLYSDGLLNSCGVFSSSYWIILFVVVDWTKLTHCGQVTSYSHIDLSKQPLRWWLVAITWTKDGVQRSDRPRTLAYWELQYRYDTLTSSVNKCCHASP